MPQLTAPELRIVKGQAQVVLVEEAEAEAARLAGEEARRREAERMAALQARVAELFAERLATAQRAQEAAENMAKELTLLHRITAEEYAARKEAGEIVRELDVGPTTRRISGLVSGILRFVTGKSLTLYGVIMLARTSKVEPSWADAERKVSPHMQNGENRNDC